MTDEEEQRFLECLDIYTSREWRDTKDAHPGPLQLRHAGRPA